MAINYAEWMEALIDFTTMSDTTWKLSDSTEPLKLDYVTKGKMTAAVRSAILNSVKEDLRSEILVGTMLDTTDNIMMEILELFENSRDAAHWRLEAEAKKHHNGYRENDRRVHEQAQSHEETHEPSRIPPN